ncbi:hypothetical protein KZO37_14040 [Rhodococcus fascians]|uniref:hypothetical protein n=1 Tax=Rhodococcoides fascians TaxID=1828 RepID=UPI001C5D0AB5|nr:hypothetical protein [Rhodococcus fascians]MBW4780488.1 hypothetical protein [Rhodococcus fascians]
MTWTRIPDDWADRVDNLELSPDAERFHVRALVVCNKAGSNGHLSKRSLAKLAAVFENVPDLLEELVEKFDWTANEDGTYEVPWDDQELAETVSQRKLNAAERQRRYRANLVAKQTDRLKTDSDASHNTVNTDDQHLNTSDASRDSSADQSGDATPSLPVPSLPKRDKGKGKREVAPLGTAPGGAASPAPEENSAPKKTKPKVEIDGTCGGLWQPDENGVMEW